MYIYEQDQHNITYSIHDITELDRSGIIAWNNNVQDSQFSANHLLQYVIYYYMTMQ